MIAGNFLASVFDFLSISQCFIIKRQWMKHAIFTSRSFLEELSCVITLLRKASC